MKNKTLITIWVGLLVVFVRCDYEGTLVEYPEQVEKPVADTNKTEPEK